MAMVSYESYELSLNKGWLEKVLLELGDKFEIRIEWNSDTALLAGICALTGGLIGGYKNGKIGAVLGAGIGGAAGLAASCYISLREIWASVKHQLQDILFKIILDYLRRLDAEDYHRAYKLLLGCVYSRTELITTIVDVIGSKLGKQVLSAITNAV